MEHSAHQLTSKEKESERGRENDDPTLSFLLCFMGAIPVRPTRHRRKREGAIDRRRRRRSNKVGPKLGMGGFFGGGRCTHTTGLYLYLERSSSQKYIGSPPSIHRFPLFLSAPKNSHEKREEENNSIFWVAGGGSNLCVFLSSFFFV